MNRTISLLLLLLGLVGCGSREELPHIEALRNAESLEVMSIDPIRFSGSKPDGVERLHGFRVLRKAQVTAPAEVRKIANAVSEGHRLYVKNGPPLMCFEPRHAVRATSGQKTIDFLLCFHCSYAAVYVGSESADSEYNFYTTNAAESILNRWTGPTGPFKN